jgi:hypothetical protein
MKVVGLPRVSFRPLRGLHFTLGFGYFSLSGWGWCMASRWGLMDVFAIEAAVLCD